MYLNTSKVIYSCRTPRSTPSSQRKLSASFFNAYISFLAEIAVSFFVLNRKQCANIKVSKCYSPLRSMYYRELGFSLPLAIFILVIVSLLALALFRMNALNQNSVAQEVLTTRALFAAESGAQAQMLRVFPISGPANCAAQTIGFNDAGLNGCSANSTCSSRLINGTTYYAIESKGRCTVAGVTALRTIEVEAK